MSRDYRGELDCAMLAAAAAGRLLRGAFHSGGREIDHSAEEEIRNILTAGFPQYGYHGEELGFVSPPQDSAGHLWLVDPNDGTSAFEQGFRGASVSIALLKDGRPVLGVVYAYCSPDDDGDWFTWAEGTGPIKRNRWRYPDQKPASLRQFWSRTTPTVIRMPTRCWRRPCASAQFRVSPIGWH